VDGFRGQRLPFRSLGHDGKRRYHDRRATATPWYLRSAPMTDSSGDLEAHLRHLQAVRRLAANTLEGYARDLQALAVFAESRGVEMRELDRTALDAWVRGLMRTGRAPASVARAIAATRGFFKFLVMDGRLSADPSGELRAPRAFKALPKY